MIHNYFFELILLSIGRRDALSHNPSPSEWKTLFDISMKQAITGICFAGVERLPKGQRPPLQVLLQWIAVTEQVKNRNRVMNYYARVLTKVFSQHGFRSCVLKGQGIAKLYCDGDNSETRFRRVHRASEVSEGFRGFQEVSEGLNDGRNLGLYRQCGDIDLWVDGEREKVLTFARSIGKIKSADVKHADFEYFHDVSVEIHSLPTWFYSPVHHRRFCKWMTDVKNEQFEVGEMGFASPTIPFNLVYSLIHIYRHLFDEGVGIRQMMDYYFILLHSKPHERVDAYNMLCRLGMKRFVSATMYVMHEIFSLEREYFLCEPSTKCGKLFMNIILEGGNFGKYNEKNRAYNGNVVIDGIRNLYKNMRLVTDYPTEVLWAPFWKIGHFAWRKAKGYS